MEEINANTLSIKRALYIDNEGQDSQYSHSFTGILRALVTDHGGEVKELLRAFQNQDKLVELLKWCDCLCFETTFIRVEQVQAIGYLLKHLKPGTVIICRITAPLAGETIIEHVLRWFDEPMIRIFNSFKLYDMPEKYINLFNDEEQQHKNYGLIPFNFDAYLNAFDARVKRLKDKKKLVNFQPTGRKVLIKKVLAFGPPWANLKEGMIVDELDCLEIEENIYRGVWVEGVNEPVKLINDDDYDEFTFVEPDAIALAIECLSMLSIPSPSMFSAFAYWLRNAPTLSGTDVHDGLSTLCGERKRGNYRRIRDLVAEYISRHQCFLDDKIVIFNKARQEEKRRRIFDEMKANKNKLKILDEIRENEGKLPEKYKQTDDEVLKDLTKKELDEVVYFLEMSELAEEV